MLSPTDIKSKIEALRAELQHAERIAESDRRAAIDAFIPQYRFTLKPAHASFDCLWDPTILVYYLRGEMLNAEDLKALGGSPFEGGMAYYYNTSTNRIMGPAGGGSIFIAQNAWGSRDLTPEDKAKLQALADFIADNPDGGDVTAIVDYKPRRSL